MAITRAQSDMLFQYSLGLVRGNRLPGGGTRVSTEELQARVAQRFAGDNGITRTETKAAVARAIRANEVGRTLTSDPNNPNAVIARNYPNKPVIDRRRGDYEYQVVIRAQGQGNREEFRVTIQSRNRLSGQEVFDRAEGVYRTQTAVQEQYRTKVRGLGTAPQLDFFIVAATAFDPTRGGVQ